MVTKMYAWSDYTHFEVLGIPLDYHTWVTTYEPGAGDPDPEKGNYWYCYGDAHTEAIKGTEGTGGEEFALRISVPYQKKDGAGLTYLLDGVCHQIANRLMRFSLDSNNRPITMAGITGVGYQLLTAAYGEYGCRTRLGTSNAEKQWGQIVESYITEKGW